MVCWMLPLRSRAQGTAIRTATTATPSSARRILQIAAWSLCRSGERKSEITKISFTRATIPPFNPPKTLQRQIVILSSFRQTNPKDKPLSFFLCALAWRDAQTHTHAGRAKVVVSDTGAAVKYYLAQSFKGETIK